jgi:hypothetical protein
MVNYCFGMEAGQSIDSTPAISVQFEFQRGLKLGYLKARQKNIKMNSTTYIKSLTVSAILALRASVGGPAWAARRKMISHSTRET